MDETWRQPDTTAFEAFPFTTETTMKQNLEAERLFEPARPAQATEYQVEQNAIKANFERLKAERLARETGRQ
jgi:hypothetical protein